MLTPFKRGGGGKRPLKTGFQLRNGGGKRPDRSQDLHRQLFYDVMFIIGDTIKPDTFKIISDGTVTDGVMVIEKFKLPHLVS